MTALILELMDITKDCFLRCDALQGLCGSWLFVCFAVFLSFASQIHAQSGWDQEIDLAIAK